MWNVIENENSYLSRRDCCCDCARQALVSIRPNQKVFFYGSSHLISSRSHVLTLFPRMLFILAQSLLALPYMWANMKPVSTSQKPLRRRQTFTFLRCSRLLVSLSAAHEHTTEHTHNFCQTFYLIHIFCEFLRVRFRVSQTISDS